MYTIRFRLTLLRGRTLQQFSGGARNFCQGVQKIQGVWVAAGLPATLTKSLDRSRLPQVSQVDAGGFGPQDPRPSVAPLLGSCFLL